MSDPFKLFDEFIDLASESKNIRSLITVSEWPDLDKVTDGTSFIEFLKDGGKSFREKKTRDIFAAANLNEEYSDVLKVLDSLSENIDEFAKRPEARLLDRLDRFQDSDSANSEDDPGLVKWQPLDASQSGGEDVYFKLAADASLEFEAGDRWPYESDSKNDPDLLNLLRVGANGKLEAKAGLKLPFDPVTLSTELSATGAANIGYYADPEDGTKLYAAAIVEFLPNIPNPVDFNEIWRAFQNSNLKAIDLQINGLGTFDTKVSVALSKGIKGVGALDVGLGVSAKVSYAPKFHVSLRAEGKKGQNIRPVNLKISRLLEKSTSLGFNVDVKLDLSELASRIGKIINQILGEFDSRIEAIRPYLTPGTWLQEKATHVLGDAVTDFVNDSDLEQMLVDDMRAALGIGTPRAALFGWAQKQIVGAIDAQSSSVRIKTTNAVDKVIAVLEQNLPATVSSKSAKLKTGVEDLIEKINTSLESEVSVLFNSHGKNLQNLIEEAAGVSTSAVTSADKALSAFKKLFDRYDGLAEDIRKATEKAAQAQLHLSFAAVEMNAHSKELLVSGKFTQTHSGNSDVFKTLLSGSASDIVSVFKNDEARAGFVMSESESWYMRRSEWASKESLNFVLLDFKISGHRLLKGDAAVKLNGAGDVTVASRAFVENQKSKLDGTQIIKLNSPLQRLDRNQPTASLTIDLTRFENNLKQREYVDFVDELTRNGLLGDSVINEGSRLLNKWGLAAGNERKIPAKIGAGLTIDSEGMKSLLYIDTGAKGPFAAQQKREVFDIILKNLSSIEYWSKKELERIAQVAAFWLRVEGSFEVGDILYQFSNAKLKFKPTVWKPKSWWTSSENKLVDMFGDPTKSNRRGGKVGKLIVALDSLRQAYLAVPSIDGAGGGWTEEQYRDAYKKASRGFGAWIENQNGKVFKPFRLTDDLSPVFVAFLKILDDLIDQANTLMWLSLTPDQGEEKGRTYLLT